jgi:23S rRNA (cytosine1962-C5)-methyltransferase
MQKDYRRLILYPNKDKSILRKHPWLFSGAIDLMDEEIEEGDIVNILSSDNKYLATGYFQNDTIAAKILSFEKEEIDQDFFDKKIKQAIDYRRDMGFFADRTTNIFRLVYSEGDFLPGLIVDYYDNNLVIQFHSVGMLKMQDLIVNSLLKNLPKTKTIFNKSSSTLPRKGKVFSKDEFIYKSTDEEYFIAKENNCKYLIDFRQGQKTGFFIDQRDNRKLLSLLSKDKTVLNAFGYTGGFSVSALKGGAKDVETLDISKRAIEICDKNVELNDFTTNHKSKIVDVVDYLNEIENDKYDIIILDPPAFAKHVKDVRQALKGYREINTKAMEKIKKGGLLFTFSCSQAVSKDDFLTMLFSCAANVNRNVRIARKLPQPFDHPQSIFHPEGEYLKGFVLQVE